MLRSSVCPNYVTLIMFPHCSIYTVCLCVSTLELRAHSPSSLPFSSLPSLNVGSSLRLHFSCLGSLLSSQLINHPPICTLNRSAPAPTVPACRCQATPRTEEGLRELRRASQGGRMGERGRGVGYQMAIRCAEITGLAL